MKNTEKLVRSLNFSNQTCQEMQKRNVPILFIVTPPPSQLPLTVEKCAPHTQAPTHVKQFQLQYPNGQAMAGEGLRQLGADQCSTPLPTELSQRDKEKTRFWATSTGEWVQIHSGQNFFFPLLFCFIIFIFYNILQYSIMFYNIL